MGTTSQPLVVLASVYDHQIDSVMGLTSNAGGHESVAAAYFLISDFDGVDGYLGGLKSAPVSLRDAAMSYANFMPAASPTLRMY